MTPVITNEFTECEKSYWLFKIKATNVSTAYITFVKKCPLMIENVFIYKPQKKKRFFLTGLF